MVYGLSTKNKNKKFFIYYVILHMLTVTSERSIVWVVIVLLYVHTYVQLFHISVPGISLKNYLL